MAQPQTKISALRGELRYDAPITEFRLHTIIRDCEGELRQVSPALAADYYAALGQAYWRLGKPEKALEQATRAAALRRYDADAHCCRGAALVDLGRPGEAADALLEMLALTEDPSEQRVTALANLAEALRMLGDVDGAVEAMRAAEKAAPSSSATARYALAVQSAAIGADGDALRFFAEFLSLRRGKEVLPHQLLAPGALSAEEALLVEQNAGLRAVHARAVAGGPELLRSWLGAPTFVTGRDGSGTREAYEASRAGIGRATGAVLPRD